MATPQQETKVERTTEAIESLVVAAVAARTNTDESRSAEFFDNVAAARSDLKEAIGTLLKPILRVIQ